jgi:hypothetical protein
MHSSTARLNQGSLDSDNSKRSVDIGHSRSLREEAHKAGQKAECISRETGLHASSCRDAAAKKDKMPSAE